MRITTAIILVFIHIQLIAQKESKYPDTRTIMLYHTDSITEANILVKNDVNISLKSTDLYYWYAFNQIQQNQGSYSGNLLHGTYKVFNSSDKLIQQGSFDKGIKEGTWVNWDKNGYVTREINYKNGKLNGSAFFYKSGKLIKKEEYRKGVLDGDVIIYNKDGSINKMKYKEGRIIVDKEDNNENFFERWKTKRSLRKKDKEKDTIDNPLTEPN